MFKAIDPHAPKFNSKTDADLSSDKPEPEYAEYILKRNLNEISESQKLTKLLQEVPSRCARSEHSEGLPGPKGMCAYNAHAPEGSNPPAQKALQGTEAGVSRPSGGGAHISALVECCCGPSSLLAKEAEAQGLSVLRLTKGNHDLTTNKVLRQAKRAVSGLIKNGHNTQLWASLPCKPWSRRNVMNAARLGRKFRRYLQELREESLVVIDSFLGLACTVFKSGRQVSFEWPAYAV